MTMAIRLVTFDLDNTLWDNDPVLQRAEQACYQYLAERAPTLGQHYDVATLARLRLELMQNSPPLAAQVSKVRKLAMQRALEDSQYPAEQIPLLVESAFRCFYDERNRITLFPQTIPLLQNLRNTYTLGSITNGNSDLEKIGLAEYFSFSLSAEKVGARKPRPNLFHGALHRGNAKPHEMVHIGDHPEDDILGARQLGIRTLWFNPRRLRWEEHSDQAPPDATAHCLSEIPDLLTHWTH